MIILETPGHHFCIPTHKNRPPCTLNCFSVTKNTIPGCRWAFLSFRHCVHLWGVGVQRSCSNPSTTSGGLAGLSTPTGNARLPATWHVALRATTSIRPARKSSKSSSLSLNNGAKRPLANWALDPLGHHRAPCAGGRFESPGIRFAMCLRSTNTGHDERVRDLDLVPQNRADVRRLEVVADGLPLFHRAQRLGHHSRFAAETRRSQVLGGLALLRARRRKELMCPE